MSAPDASSPRLVRAVLGRVLPAAWRTEALRDLDEMHGRVAAARGALRARIWYWRQALGLLSPDLWLGRGRPRLEAPVRHAPPAGRSNPLSGLAGDARYGLRVLAASPGNTAVIVVTLAVGLGFNGAVFSLLDTIVLADLPLADPDRVLFVEGRRPEDGREGLGLSLPELRDLQARSRAFEILAGFTAPSVNVADGAGFPERVEGARVLPEIFDVVGLEPVLGRRFTAADARPGAAEVALVGHALWQARWGGDADVVGRVVRVNGTPTTVVGVLPPELERSPFRPAVWVPLRSDASSWDRDDRFLVVLGRLAPAVDVDAARREVDAIGRWMAEEYPATSRGHALRAGTFDDLYTETPNRVISWVMMGAVALLLLIACANVANLLLAGSLYRGREVAIRAALGAGRWRVARQLLVESGLLSLAGGGLGVLVAAAGARGLERAIAPAQPPPWWEFGLDPGVLGFMAVATLGTSLLFGMAPALHTLRRDPGDALRAGGRGGTGGRSGRIVGGLVVVQVALALVLLTGAGLMIRTTLNVAGIDVGASPEGVVTARLRLDDAGYPGVAQRIAFHDELRRRVRELPGVDAVGLASNLPTRGAYDLVFEVEGRPAAAGGALQAASQTIVDPGYFELMGVEASAGRLLDAGDGPDAPAVAVVDQRFARRTWPDDDPVGQRFRWAGEEDGPWMTVVGVVPGILQSLPLSFVPDHPVVYTPYGQEALRDIHLLARGKVPAGVLADRLRREVQELDPALPLFDVARLEEVIVRSSWGFRVASVIFAILAAVAALISCLGIYGVIAFTVGRQRRELGVRLALGARTPAIVARVVAAGMVRTTAGLGLGLAGAWAMTRALGIFLYELSPTDPLTFGASLTLLASTALVACWLPARRAARVDPVVALEAD